MASENSTGPPIMRTGSCTFQFEFDYSKTKDLPIGKCISSPTFSAGGYDWFLDYYPQEYEQGSNISLYLILASEVRYAVTTEYTFQLLGKKRNFVNISKTRVRTFEGQYYATWSYDKFIPRNEIETSYCLNEIVVISCVIRVLNEQTAVRNHPGGLCQHIERFWKKEKRFDVTFEVEGESISAHRFLLAARSPVFEAKLFGPMAETNMECIKINEMKAEVFKALLHFVYTDRLPIDESSDDEPNDDELSNDEPTGDETSDDESSGDETSDDESSDDETSDDELSEDEIELLRGLLAAADLYALHKLTLMCEKQLERNLSIDTVAATLILADRHSRTTLKRKCLNFASAATNFWRVALTEGYMQIRSADPALFAELSEEVKAQQKLKG